MQIPPKTPLPVRWSDPRVWTTGQFSKPCDVFSYGVCIYEMTQRTVPWTGKMNDEVAALVTDGEHLPRPTPPSSSEIDADTLTELYAIMEDCWKQNVAERPVFHDLRHRLAEACSSRQNPYALTPSGETADLVFRTEEFYENHYVTSAEEGLFGDYTTDITPTPVEDDHQGSELPEDYQGL
jgi:serine/threonine protein kinase